MDSDWEQVEVDAVPDEGECVAALVDDEAKYVIVNVDGRHYGLDNLCTHGGGWLDMGTVHPESGEIECPFHGGRFDLASGKPTAEPCTEPVGSYEVRVDGDAVFVRARAGDGGDGT